MGLVEWVIVVVPSLGLFGLSAYIGFKVRHPHRLKRIPLEIQAEIDVTPEWWDAQFRKLQGLPPLRETTFGDFRRWAERGTPGVTEGDPLFRLKYLIDPKPPTINEIWTPTQGSSYDLSVDLAAMMSALEEAKTNDR